MRFPLLSYFLFVVLPLSAQQPLSDYKIAYNVYYDTAQRNYEIFVMDPDGRNQKNISNWKGADWVYCAWKDKLFFVSDRDTTYGKYHLYEMDVDGNDVRKITDFLVDDSFLGSRADGQELVITSRRDGKKAFYIIDLNGKILQKITPPGLESFNDPMFLPGGNQIVFRGAKQSSFKTRKKNDPISNDELYLMNVDGTGLKQLTYYPPQDTTPEWHSYHAGPPRWNEKEKTVTYMSFQSGKYEVYGVGLTGARSFNVVHHELESGWHDWTPDGQWMVVELSRPKEFDIYLVNRGTGAATRLTHDWRYEQAPVFVKRKRK